MKTKLLKPAASKTIIAMVAFLFLTVSSNAQQKNLLGIYGTAEWGQGRGLRNALGIIYERKFTNHFGIETGAILNNFSFYNGYSALDNSKHDAARINHLYLNVPVLFKYYSNIVNVAAGPTFNTKLAEFRTGNLTREINHLYYVPPKDFAIGYQFKISKSLNLKDKFVLEPEINVGNPFEFKKPLVGIGASFKYKF